MGPSFPLVRVEFVYTDDSYKIKVPVLNSNSNPIAFSKVTSFSKNLGHFAVGNSGDFALKQRLSNSRRYSSRTL